VAYCFVEAEASEEIQKRRLEGREERTNEISDARLEDFDKLNQAYEAPLELEARHLISVGTDRPLETTVTQTLAFIAQKLLGNL
jgi:thymidylate kinase